MKLISLSTAVLAITLAATPSSAATILFDVCSDAAALCNHLQLTSTLNGSAVDVAVTGLGGTYGIFGNTANHAFGININGSGVGFSNVTPGFSFAGTNDRLNGYGNFEFIFDGPHTGSAASLPLNFTVTRSGGFADAQEIFEFNSSGNLAAAHLRNNATGLTGFVAANDLPTNTTPVPEPATMLLLGTGLLAAYRARRT